MSSQRTGRIGAQEPRWLVKHESHFDSDGPDAVELARTYANDPDKWQADVLETWLARNADDKPTYITLALAVPRQNGKNDIIQDFELYKMIVCGEGILHTAHQVKTANKAFQRLAAIFSDPSHPELGELVVNIRRTNGEQGIYLTNGGFIEYSARSRGASRGNTYSVLIIDEAQEYTDEQAEALTSTLSASPTGYRQMVYTGTPPGPSSPGTVFDRLRMRALNDPSKSMCYHEWSVDDLPKQGVTYEELVDSVYLTNPAMGIRLDDDFTREEFSTMSLDGFARERLGWWCEGGTVNTVFSLRDWSSCEVETLPQETENEKRCVGVKFTPDGEHVALSLALKNGEQSFIEGLFFEPLNNGTSWISDWLIERKSKFAEVWIDGKVNSSALVTKLRDGGFPMKAVRLMNSRDVSDSASMLHDAIVEKKVLHTKQDMMDKSATKSQKRIIGDKFSGAWGFGDGEVSCAPIESASFAYMALMTTKRNPNRKLRVG